MKRKRPFHGVLIAKITPQKSAIKVVNYGSLNKTHDLTDNVMTETLLFSCILNHRNTH